MTIHLDRLIYNLEGLESAIADVKEFVRCHASTIYVESNDGPSSEDGMRFRLVEDVLSDGSSVFNIILGA